MKRFLTLIHDCGLVDVKSYDNDEEYFEIMDNIPNGWNIVLGSDIEDDLMELKEKYKKEWDKKHLTSTT